MIREYSSSIMVPSSVLVLASRCELISYSCGITGFCLMLVRTSTVLAGTLIGATLLVVIMARSALSVPTR